MPFLEGVPCSIHGMVLPDGTAVFRPVELAILRDAGRRFVYGGQGTSWDPADRDREEMRDLVRRTGEHLRERADYRGAFGIDGVMTADGFRPTELNPRFSGGLNTLARGVGHAAFSLLQYALVAGRDPGVSTAELERWALAAMDAERVVKPLAVSDRRVVEESREVRLSWDGERLRRDDEGRSPWSWARRRRARSPSSSPTARCARASGSGRSTWPDALPRRGARHRLRPGRGRPGRPLTLPH